MSKLIPPTPGRVVWYYPSQHEIDAKTITLIDPAKPLAATVAHVFDDRLVNLSIVDQVGAQFRRTSVQLLQEDDPVPHTSEGPYATWMPFQLGQAAKAAEADAAQAPATFGVDPAASGADQTAVTEVTAALTEGDIGAYTAYSTDGSKHPKVNAVVTKVWSDTCVNVETESGEQQSSVLVYRGTGEIPAGNYFEPGLQIQPPLPEEQEGEAGGSEQKPAEALQA